MKTLAMNAKELFVSFFVTLLATLVPVNCVRAAERELTVDIIPVVITAPGEDVKAKSEIPNDYCTAIVREGAKIVEETGCGIKFEILPTRRIVSDEYADLTVEEYSTLSAATELNGEPMPKRAVRVFFARSYEGFTQEVRAEGMQDGNAIAWTHLVNQKSILVIRRSISEYASLAAVVCGRSFVAVFADSNSGASVNLMRSPPAVGYNPLNATQILRLRTTVSGLGYAYYPPTIKTVRFRGEDGRGEFSIAFTDLIEGRTYLIEKSTDLVNWETEWTGSFGRNPSGHYEIDAAGQAKAFLRISCLGD